MSKTATVAHSKNLRNSYGTVGNTSHHLINRAEVENVKRSKDSASRQKQGYVVAENSKIIGKRNNSGHTVNVENNFSNNTDGKSKMRYVSTENGDTAKYGKSNKSKSGKKIHNATMTNI